jgi:hypothetical protein
VQCQYRTVKSTEVNDSWQTKIKAVEAAINRSAAVQGISRTILTARVKPEKKGASILTEVNANRNSPVPGGHNREGLAGILIHGPAATTIRTERANEAYDSGSAR